MLSLAEVNTDRDKESIRSFYHYIFLVLGVAGYEEATAWNDAPGRTLEEVVDVLRRAKELVK